MSSLLQIENLTKSFGDRLLFGDITFGINEGDKIGLIAKNGTGKSTLLKIILGEEPQDSGSVTFRSDLRCEYLQQIPTFDDDLSVIDVCLCGDDALSVAVREYEMALSSLDEVKITEAIQKMDNLKAWDHDEQFKQILSQFNITDFNQKIGELSGGQIKRIAIAKIINANPELLILDEPTNHLDIEMIEWLENYLSRSKIALLMVTHDRYFLDKVCNKIIEIDQHQIFTYFGNYNYYLEKREQRIQIQNAEVAKAKNLLRTELDWMRRQPQARGSKAKYRIDAFYDLEKKAAQKNIESNVELDIKSSYIGSKIFIAKHISKKFGSKIILNDFNYTFARYDKLGIVGDNGVGKSTFIKLLQGDVAPDSGHFDIGETVKFGYYSQEGMKFNESKKVIDVVKEIAEHITFDEKTSYSASQFLQLFLFSPSDQQKLIEKLSGGEKRRLYLAIVLLKKPNFLILDEPTNDLDIVTLEILEEYLLTFKGCVIIISHDRFFMDRCVNHIFVFEGNGKIKDFPGSYSQYREWKILKDKEESQQAKNATPTVKGVKTASPAKKDSGRMSYKETKEFEQLSTEIDSLSAEKESIEAKFTSIDAAEDITALSQRYEEIKSILDEKEMRWLELSEKKQ